MNEFTLRITPQERDLLTRLLDDALAEVRVEVHHTHLTPHFREKVLDEETELAGLLTKVRAVAHCTNV
jgi:hypothetical protein